MCMHTACCSSTQNSFVTKLMMIQDLNLLLSNALLAAHACIAGHASVAVIHEIFFHSTSWE